ncbi:bifunctional diaminohydroxyphosphoribosylaminopyrimidine deaminase/5-amino-6-(5-phosphoribosylamino)uracil reductase RibD [Weissella confusa]|uniref:bifunctional diaminohydroxyphosphoribosylaminopyrimidine deaminase/5-amino-6-(5-phosphoribosylamino)uracil reductase RibD n=1 Tax=Weissella confusa TaxID=1583 RepID=UPI00396F4864
MDDLTMMQVAVAAAEKAAPKETWTNPRVGAVIVKNGAVLATGYHHQFGQAHAEVDAMQQVDNPADLNNATMYVTLEPCAHVGKVGACADAIVAAGISRVVVGQGDPNPLVHGQGIRKLRAAGIIVDVLNQPVSEKLNPVFHHFFETGQPYVMLKVAQSADGFITKAVGQSTKITDAITDVVTHEQRAEVGAIIVGSETALTDTPSLTVRHTSITHPQPLRVILDRRGRLQSESKFVDDRTLIYTMNEAFAATIEQAILFDGRLQSVLNDLGQRGVQSVLVEGGGAVLRAFLAADLWQRLDIYQTTTVFGTGVAGIQVPTTRATVSERIGNAMHHIYYRERK